MLTRKAFFGAVFFFTSITENMMVTDGKFSDQHISWAKNCPKFFILYAGICGMQFIRYGNSSQKPADQFTGVIWHGSVNFLFFTASLTAHMNPRMSRYA